MPTLRYRNCASRARRRPRGLAPDQAGFTIVEALSALLVVSIILLAFTYTLMSGYRALRDARNFQQATAFGNEAMERARDLPFDDLVMDDADVAADTANISGAGSCAGITGDYFFDPDGPADGDLSCEEIVSTAAGAGITDHITTEVFNGTTFNTRVYLTWVRIGADGNPSSTGSSATNLKRITAIVDWTVNNTTKRFRTSTFIARSRRGLPVPKFDVDPPGDSSLSVQQGEVVVFPHTVTNLGITDTYDLELTPPPGRSWDADFYEDKDRDGIFDYSDTNADGRFTEGIDIADGSGSTDEKLTLDTNGTGVVDTGPVVTSDASVSPDPGKFFFLAVWSLPLSEPTGGPLAATLSVTSGADPAVVEARRDLLTVTGIPQPLRLFLHDLPTPPTGSSASDVDLAMNETAPTATTLFNYSTDLTTPANPPNSQGRLVRKRTPNAATNSMGQREFMVNWVHLSPPGGYILDGQATLRTFVTCSTTQFEVFLQNKNNQGANSGIDLNGGARQIVTPVPPPNCSDFYEVNYSWTIPRSTVAGGRFIDLKFVIPDSGPGSGRFAYDTVSQPATLTLPRVAS